MKGQYFFVLVAFLCIRLSVLGADINWSDRITGQGIVQGHSVDFQDGDFHDLLDDEFIDVKQYAYVHLGLDEMELMDYRSTNAHIYVKFRLTPYTDAGDDLPSTDYELEIDYSSQPGRVKDFDELKISNLYKFKIEILEVKIDDVAVSGSNPLLRQAYLETGIKAERYYKLDMSSYNTGSPVFPTISANSIQDVNGVPDVDYGIASIGSSSDEIEFSWPYIAGAEEYEIEWTWVDAYSDASGTATLNADEIDLDDITFKNNCTRIRTSHNSYRISNLFAKGYVIYRVRAVGRWLDSPQKEKFTKWSSDAFASKEKVADWGLNIIFVTDDHTAKINWQYQSTYAENGKKKEVASYFDGSLRNRQMVTRINSNHQAVVSETIYDNEGRGVLQLLPTPLQKNQLRYFGALNLNTSNDPYSHTDFDWENINLQDCQPVVSGMVSPDEGAGLYYSSSHTEDNWQRLVPDAEGYPYTQVEYTPDNTGRIRRQSGVGTNFKIGSGQETEYFYFQPTQFELNRLFGYKVGYQQRYKKNMVVDPNNQVSVSYLDPQGRVIATALSGTNNTPFTSLANPYGTQNTYTDFLNKLDQGAHNTNTDNNMLLATGRYGTYLDALVVNTQLGVVDPTDYDFHYTAGANSYYQDVKDVDCGEGEMPVYPFVYDIQLSLVDDCGGDKLAVNLLSQPQGATIGSTSPFSYVNDFASLDPDHTDVLLQQGTYTLSKEIRVNQSALDSYLAHYLSENNPCFQTLEDFQLNFTPECNTSCAECEADLGNLAAYLAANPYNSADSPFASQTAHTEFYTNEHAFLLAECRKPCEILSNCETTLGALMADVSPLGQYGAVENDANSVLLNHWSNPSTPYLDKFGNDDFVTVTYLGVENGIRVFSPALSDPASYPLLEADETVNVSPEELTFAAFLANWNSSWAESLIDHHPEYQLYLFQKGICDAAEAITFHVGTESQTLDLNSDQFDAVLREQINTYADADASSFLDLVTADPFFGSTHTVTGSITATTLMNEALGDYDGTGISMVKYASKMVLCANAFYDYTCTAASGLNTWTDIATSSLTAGQKDEIWNQYKSLYVSQKQKIYQLLMDLHGFSETVNVYNGCIGDGHYQPFNAAKNFIHSAHYTALLDRIVFLEFDLPIPGYDGTHAIPFCGSYYDGKQMRIVRNDALYNTSASAQETLDELALQADYETWDQTGLCPTIFDLQQMLNGMGRHHFAAGNYVTSQVPEFSRDLYEYIVRKKGLTAANYIDVGSVSFDLTRTSGSVGITLKNSNQSTSVSAMTLNIIGTPISGYTLTDLGSSWHVTEISGAYPVPGSPDKMILNLKGIMNQAPFEPVDYVVALQGDFVLQDCQAFFEANSKLDPDCDKDELIEAELVAFFKESLDANTTDNGEFSTLDLNTHPTFGTSELAAAMGGFNNGNPNILNIYENISDQITSFTFDNGIYPYIISFDQILFSSLEVIDVLGINLSQGGPGQPNDHYTITLLVSNNDVPEVHTYSGFAFLDNDPGIKLNGLNYNCDCERLDPDFAEIIEDNNFPLTKDVNQVPLAAIVDTPFELDQLFLNEIYNRLSKGIFESSINVQINNCGSDQIPTISLPELEQYRSTLYPQYAHLFIVPLYTVEGGYPTAENPFESCKLGKDYVLNFGITDDPCHVHMNNQHQIDESTLLCLYKLRISNGQFNIIRDGLNPIQFNLVDPSFNGNLTVGGYNRFSVKVGSNTYYPAAGTCYSMEEIHSCDVPLIQGECACKPALQEPLSCMAFYNDYTDLLLSFGYTKTDDLTVGEILTPGEFCASELVYVFPAYAKYLDELNIDDVDDLGYLTIGAFANTPLGYSTHNLDDAVIRYVAEVGTLDNSDVLWKDFVNQAYLSEYDLCPMPGNQVTPYIAPDEEPCQQWTAATLEANARVQYEAYLEQLGDLFVQNYITKAMDALVETFTETHQDREHHYTLYYYDRAGNLVQTVPPAGVDRMDLNLTTNQDVNTFRAANPDQTLETATDSPVLDYRTIYRYNTLNQLVYQSTPDGGESRFAYDALGRLVVSQNAKQFANNAYSYTKYDALGRQTEVGEMTLSGYLINDNGDLVLSGTAALADVSAANFPANLGVVTNQRREVTRSVYDAFGGFNPQNSGVANTSQLFENYSADNTRNRIVAVVYQLKYHPSINICNSASLYDYDVHGNVKELVQLINEDELVDLNQHIKKVKYDYDMISGNVKEVAFQEEKADEFHHQYLYDADNRITNVYTSADGNNYEQDAKYFYYDHGPLARTELADDKAASMDYAYTIQGWIKTVNGENPTADLSIGKNGKANHVNTFVAQNSYGFSLNYHDNDYQSSDETMLGNSSQFQAGLNQQSVYNGNIRSMYVAMQDHDEEDLNKMIYHYQYDQLNRLLSMSSKKVNLANTAFTDGGYTEKLTYDANGNIETLKRTDHNGALFDNLDHQYHFGSNRLLHVDELSSDLTNGTLDDITDQGTGNYDYDAIGQLTEDKAEKITGIKWTVTNKVQLVEYDLDNDLAVDKHIDFVYDPMGRRIAKKEYGATGNLVDITYYYLDAQGNPMSIYTWKEESGNDNLYLTERSIYGSRRTGLENIEKIIASSGANVTGISYFSGDKHYEMANHLGNVLNVITDHKLPNDGINNDLLVDNFMADVISYSDYYPFGMQIKSRNGSDESYRYGFQGYENDNEVKGEGNSYTTEFRQYDPRLGRWLSMDPKIIKYPDMSPYNAHGDNPILNVDLKGDTIARFTWDGKYIDWVDDGKPNWIGRRENAVKNVDPKTQKVTYSHEYFIFADPINDPKALKDGTITHLVFVYETDIKEMLKEAGAFNPDNQGGFDGPLYLKEEGKGNGEFDFSMTKIPSHDWGDRDVTFIGGPINNKTDALFYVKSQKTAHNHFNFGNFLFGAGGQALGLDLGILLLGAQYNSLKNSKTNGYNGQPDSPDDQLSIGLGFKYAKEHKFNDIHINPAQQKTNEDGER